MSKRLETYIISHHTHDPCFPYCNIGKAMVLTIQSSASNRGQPITFFLLVFGNFLTSFRQISDGRKVYMAHDNSASALIDQFERTPPESC